MSSALASGTEWARRHRPHGPTPERDTSGRYLEWVGRVGLASYGVVHVLVAVLAVRIAALRPHTRADPRGAVAIIAAGGVLGRILLAVAAVALTVFVAWQVRAAVAGFRWVSDPGERWRKRGGALAKAAGVGSVAWLALTFAAHLHTDHGGMRRLTAATFAAPGGRLLVGAVALGLFVMTGSMTYTAIRGTFMGDLVLDRVPPRLRGPTRALGAAGNLTRAVTFGTIGVLTADATWRDQPDKIGGVDLALRTLASHTPGTVALGLAAAGFAAYGLYCFVDAWARHP